MPRNIQRFKVVVIVLNFGAFSNTVTNLAKKLFDALKGASDWMQATALLTTAGQGDIDGLGSQLAGQGYTVQMLLARIEGILYLLFSRINQRTGFRAFFSRQFTQQLHLQSQLTFFTKIVNTQLLHGLRVIASSNSSQGLCHQRIKIFHTLLQRTLQNTALALCKVLLL